MQDNKPNYGTSGTGTGTGTGLGSNSESATFDKNHGLYELNPQTINQFTQAVQNWQQQARSKGNEQLANRFDSMLTDLGEVSQVIGQEGWTSGRKP